MDTSDEQLIQQTFNEIRSVEIDNFKPIGTIKVALFQFVLACSLEILGIILFLTRENYQNACGQIIVILFSQTALWAISCIFDSHYRSSHNLLRLRGHLTYHKTLNNLSVMFLHLISIGNAVIICTIGILFQLNTGQICHYNNYFSPTYIIFYIFTAEIIILVPNFVNYMLNVHFFNKVRPLSDIEKFECWSSSDPQTRSEIGYRLECDAVSGFLEKQADLIHYYKLANNDLSKKLHEVQNGINSATYNNDTSALGTSCEIHMS